MGRPSTRRVAQSATHVRINREAAAALASPSGRLSESEVAASLRGKFFEFDDASHVIANDDALTAQLILAIDAVNFCFWPDGELEYEHVSGGLSACARRDPSALWSATQTQPRVLCVCARAVFGGARARARVRMWRSPDDQTERYRLKAARTTTAIR